MFHSIKLSERNPLITKDKRIKEKGECVVRRFTKSAQMRSLSMPRMIRCNRPSHYLCKLKKTLSLNFRLMKKL